MHHFAKIPALVFTFLFPLALVAAATSVQIPEFTPNVVDPDHTLSQQDTREINSAFQELREQSGIMPAVYILNDLRGDSIENLAVEAFQKWKLGSKKVDNGLLLVLAMNQHKSRFEVGYGLEGSLTDLTTKVALDEHLKPLMKQQQYKQAIIESFQFLSQVHLKDPAALEQIEEMQNSKSHQDNYMGGFLAWFAFVLCLWAMKPLTKIKARTLAAALERDSKYKMSDDPFFNSDASTMAVLSKGMGGPNFSFTKYFLPLFLTVNPGIFIFFAGLGSIYTAYGIAAVGSLVGLIYYWRITSRYVNGSARSAAYQLELQRTQQHNLQIVAMREKFKNNRGTFKKASGDTWASSSSSDSWSSSSSSDYSSSSSDSSSSSSDGGSSGGGGSSSDW
jgi:uncharacterized protein